MATLPDPEKALKNTLARWDEAELVPVIGVELEFYCPQQPNSAYEIEKEVGEHQYEVGFPPSKNILRLTSEIALFKERLAEQDACFDARPDADQPGSGMHIHLHVENHEQENLLEKDGEEESVTMQQAVAGLLHFMPKHMLAFAPSEESYARFQNDPRGETPTTISWGGNNRTTALRIPDSGRRRIEHRVSGADADPKLAIAAVLVATLDGITAKSKLTYEKIHGRAYDAQYQLKSLPLTHNAALQHSDFSLFSLNDV